MSKNENAPGWPELIYAAATCVTVGFITIPIVLPYSWGSMLHKVLAVLQ